MSQEAINIMQGLRNRAGTKSKEWDAFQDASYLGYKAAYKNHKDALDAVKHNLELDFERCWMVFTLLWGITAGPVGSIVGESLSEWAGRLIEPSDNAGKLANEILHTAVDSMEDQVKELISKSKLEEKAMSADESRPWEPVVDDPETYGAKMKLTLDAVGGEIMETLDDLVTRAASWSAAQASMCSAAFENSCPYMTDVPLDVAQKSFIAKVQNTAEWAMWVEWGISRDEHWWSEHNEDGNEMLLWRPVLYALRRDGLAIPIKEITSTQRAGDGFFNTAVLVLDMPKFINWAKRNKQARSRHWTKAQLKRAHDLLMPQAKTQDQLQCYAQQ